jgi:hypothetical protein
MLRAQARLVSFCPRIDQVDRLACQGGEGDGLPHNGTAAGIAGAVDSQNCAASPSEGHARVNPIPGDVGTSAP